MRKASSAACGNAVASLMEVVVVVEALLIRAQLMAMDSLVKDIMEEAESEEAAELVKLVKLERQEQGLLVQEEMD